MSEGGASAASQRDSSRYGHTGQARDADDVIPWIRAHAQAHGFTLDAAQDAALVHFARVARELEDAEKRGNGLLRLLARKRDIRGLYIYGGVGRGKSFLMDSFCNCVPYAAKRRVHFHRFMQEIHYELARVQGQADPLAAVARHIAAETRLLCLDEFHVTDITDAMLMKRLLEGLMEQGVVLVTTSNFHPDELYEHGLQRNRFLPAIALIKERLEIANVDSGTDYRLRELERAGVYHVEESADASLEDAFHAIARHETLDGGELEIEGRMIPVRQHAREVAWFDFSALCDGPRGKADYIELARRYETILLSGVPRFTVHMADQLRRFVWLIDEFYDRRVKLMVSADALPDALFVDGDEDDAFQVQLNTSLKQRLTSRLTEMQTREYLSQPHLP
ncbi:MAG TPA: cell division protein ZapE [Burkholderiales bacterium]|nr:cell division protein ZapE [Burkholderiales bacterium]